MWKEYPVRERICNELRLDRVRQSITFSQWYPNALQKFYIPPVPPMDLLTFFVAKKPGSGSVFMAMKYGSPPDIQGDVTHPNPKPRDFLVLKDLEKGVNIRFDAAGSRTTPLLKMGSAALGKKAGDYLYMNFYQNRNRVLLISMTMTVNVQQALEWCQNIENIEDNGDYIIYNNERELIDRIEKKIISE